MKLFATPRRVIVPPAWIAALGEPRHIRQAYVAAAAKSKPDAARMLADAGAWRLDGELRMIHGRPSDPIVLLRSSGVIDLAVPGLWAWAGAVNGNAVISIAGGTCRVAAHWRYNPAAGIMRVEKTSE